MKRRFVLLNPGFLLKAFLLLLLLAYILAVVVPYIPHKKVSQAYQDHFASMTFLSDKMGTERAAYIDDNTDALLCRLKLISQAKEEVILSTFDFDQDQGGRDILAALMDAAQRGVKVRVIVDGGSGFLDVRKGPLFHTLAAEDNVELKIYNPVNLLRPWTLQARLHDKYLIADRQAYLLGGRNTTDLFLGEYSPTPNIDRELLVLETADDPGSSLYQLLDYFEQVWTLPDSRTFHPKLEQVELEAGKQELNNRFQQLHSHYAKAFVPWNWEDITFPTNKITLLHNPVNAGNKEPWMWYSISNILSQSKQACLYTPYIICGKEMYQDLTNLTQNGLELEVITNDPVSGANPWGCTDYLNQKKKIWNTGIQVYEYMGEHSCHTKAAAIDDRLTLLGSYNLDMRSTYQDTELMLAVDSVHLNQLLRNEAERDKTFSKTAGQDGSYTYGEHYVPRELSFGKGLFYGVLRVLTVPVRGFL